MKRTEKTTIVFVIVELRFYNFFDCGVCANNSFTYTNIKTADKVVSK